MNFMKWEDYKKNIDFDKNIIVTKYLPESWWNNLYKRLISSTEYIETDPEYLLKYYISDENIDKYNSYVSGNRNDVHIYMGYFYILFYKIYLLMDKVNDNLKNENKEFEKSLRLHKSYKRRYYIGMFLWMTSCFWLPFIIGMISGYNVADKYFNGIDVFYSMCVSGFEGMLVASFTYIVTFPLSLFIGVYVHPKVLKSLMFNDENPYNESLMNALGSSKYTEKNNAKAVLAGTVLGKIID